MRKIVLIVLVFALTGCAARHESSSTDTRPCSQQPDQCWTYQRTPLGWGWCRLENGTKVCKLLQ
jgi:hypothetical protein